MRRRRVRSVRRVIIFVSSVWFHVLKGFNTLTSPAWTEWSFYTFLKTSLSSFQNLGAWEASGVTDGPWRILVRSDLKLLSRRAFLLNSDYSCSRLVTHEVTGWVKISDFKKGWFVTKSLGLCPSPSLWAKILSSLVFMYWNDVHQTSRHDLFWLQSKTEKLAAPLQNNSSTKSLWPF